MQDDVLYHENYKFTNDYAVIEALHPTPSGLEDKMHDYHQQAQKGKASLVQVLLKEIKRYPRYPELKTLLMMLYHKMGQFDKSDEWVLKTAVLHPDYLPGKVNAAFVHFENEDFEKMQDLMGKGFHLNEMYPNRELFHIAEMTLLQKVAVHYYCAIGDFEQAKMRLDILEQLDKDGDDTVRSRQFFIASALKEKKTEFLSKELLLKLLDEESIMGLEQEFDKPDLINQELNDLFEYGSDIPEDVIDEILALPRQELIADLETIVNFAVSDGVALIDQVIDTDQTYFLSHALELLAILEAEESLSTVMQVFEQDEDFIEFYFGEFATEYCWDVIMRLGKNQLDVLFDFMKIRGIYTYNRAIICAGVEQMYFHYPEKKEDVVAFFETLINYFLACEDYKIVDPLLNQLIVGHLVNIREERLTVLIEKMYDADIVQEDVFESRESTYEALDRPLPYDPKQEVLTLQEKLDKMVNIYPDRFEDIFPDLIPELDTFPKDLESANLLKADKVGRNEPCPCGSGKKYKKCCLAD